MRPLLLLVPSAAPGAPALSPLALAVAQGGWAVQVLGGEPLWIEEGGSVVLVVHGAASADLAALEARVAASGGDVAAVVLVDPDPHPDIAHPSPGRPSHAPVGVLRLRRDAPVPGGTPWRDAPGGPLAPEHRPRGVAGPLLHLLGDLAVPGGLR